jgi:hypothetical protein
MNFLAMADFETLINLKMHFDILVKSFSFSNCWFRVRLPILILVILYKDLEKLRSS